jgi:hypothetical protein
MLSKLQFIVPVTPAAQTVSNCPLAFMHWGYVCTRNFRKFESGISTYCALNPGVKNRSKIRSRAKRVLMRVFKMGCAVRV